MNDATQHASACGELLWQRLIRHLRLGYRTIVEDLADLDHVDTEILLGLAVQDVPFSLDIYENRSSLEEGGISPFRLPALYRRSSRSERMRMLDRLMQQKISSLLESTLRS